jgi:predicted enzyme related to lactoylglutathione lyase
VSFYTELFGWEAEDSTPPESPSKYFVCTRRGRDVTAIGSQPPEHAGHVPAWDTYIWVESADDTLAKVNDAGGSVIIEPIDHLDFAARMAVVADPAGAVFSVSKVGPGA